MVSLTPLDALEPFSGGLLGLDQPPARRPGLGFFPFSTR